MSAKVRQKFRDLQKFFLRRVKAVLFNQAFGSMLNTINTKFRENTACRDEILRTMSFPITTMPLHTETSRPSARC